VINSCIQLQRVAERNPQAFRAVLGNQFALDVFRDFFKDQDGAENQNEVQILSQILFERIL
jgi:hypothetical protein